MLVVLAVIPALVGPQLHERADRALGTWTSLASTEADERSVVSPVPPVSLLVDQPRAESIALPAVQSTVGQLISQVGGQSRLCTASVVASRSRSVAVTAAHCVYSPERFAGAVVPADQVGWVDETVFVPGAAAAAQPFGVWDVEEIVIDPRWEQDGDPAHDVAFLRLAPLDGESASDVLGAQGIGQADQAPPSALSAVGYPGAPPFTGDEVLRCGTEDAGVDARLGGNFVMTCDMTEGSSGGPWLAELDETTGLGVVVAVTSLRVVGTDDIAAARLGPDAMALFARIDDQPE